jgi:hypothetical protein
MTLMSKITQLARTPQGRKLAEKAQQKANDPKTKAQIAQARERLAKRGTGSGGGPGSSGAAGPTASGTGGVAGRTDEPPRP